MIHPNVRSVAKIHSKRYAKGLSLVELMVSLTIGLILLGGLLAAYLSAAQTWRRKTTLEQALEAFRYGSYSISRLVRQSKEFDSTSTASSLSLIIPQNGENCAGVAVASSSGEINTLTITNGSLSCTPGASASQSLIEGISNWTITYGIDANADNRLASSEYVASPGNWDQVTSVKIIFTLVTDSGSSGLQQEFVATSRLKALEMAGK